MTDNENLIAEARALEAEWGQNEGEAIEVANRLADALASATKERDDAIREMHARELHHFEEEQKSARAQACIDKVRALLPGPRTFTESLSRDFEGKVWPRQVDADAVSGIIAAYDKEQGT